MCSYPGTPTDLHAVAVYDWDPAYVDRTFPSKHDLAAFVLKDPVQGIEPAGLPTAGQLHALAGGGGLLGTHFESVGYGIQGIDRGHGPLQPIGSPVETGLFQRRVTVSEFSALTPTLPHLLTEDALGFGGNCSGDPHLLPGTSVVAATSSWITTCAKR